MTNELNKHIQNLREYCNDDKVFRSQTAEEEKSDFDIFCENHIADIEAVIAELEKNSKLVDLMSEYIGNEDTSEEFCKSRYNPIPTECDENCKLCVLQYFEQKVSDISE